MTQYKLLFKVEIINQNKPKVILIEVFELQVDMMTIY
jgi:hypothetical protein